MTDEDLMKANKIKKEIKQLEYFIFAAERRWTGSIIKRKPKFIFKANSYGFMEDSEYEMDTEMKNRVLDVLKERLSELDEELASI